MKRIFTMILATALILATASCSPSVNDTDGELSFTDDLGFTVTFSTDDRVAAGHASFADCWLLSGGSLVGITADAIEDHGLVADGAMIIGTAKTVDLEALVASGATLVLLSADLTAHRELKPTLDSLGIKSAFFRVDNFEDYENIMAKFCAISGRDDLFYTNVTAVKQGIEESKARKDSTESRSFLLMRAYSSGIKAKSDDNLAGLILKEFGLKNIVDDHPSMLEDLSVEYIVSSDPDLIFVLTMGDEDAALSYLESTIESSPAFASLSAIKGGRLYVLPKELFHYKPNEKWDESYEHIADILYPKNEK